MADSRLLRLTLSPFNGTPTNVLRLAANLIRESSRAADFVCRYGGEEFCALLPDTNEEGATVWAERVRAALAEATFTVNGRSGSAAPTRLDGERPNCPPRMVTADWR